MTDHGQYLQALNEAVVSAFPDTDGLKELIRFQFDLRIQDEVSLSTPNKTIVFDTIELFEAKGELEQLISAIAQVRSNNALFRAFCSQYHPEFINRVADSQAASDVADGLQTIKRARQSQPEVNAVLKDISDEIEIICNGILALKLLKQLHEVLHIIDFKFFKLLVSAAKNYRARPTGTEEAFELRVYTSDFEDKVVEARKLTEKLVPADRVLEGWVEKLALAAEMLRAALLPGSANPLTPIQTLIRPTLGQAPSVVYARLAEDARQIPLDHLLTGIRQMKPLFQDENNRLLKSCELGLAALQQRLRDVISEHYFWQKIDINLRLIDNAIDRPAAEASWLEDLQCLLPSIIREIETICTLRHEAEWREPLEKSWLKLRQALELNQPENMRFDYYECQRLARGRFYNVDAELLEVCTQLVTLNGPLAELNSL
ncbi:effector-associated domain EAD1-containing protein [Anatilimnocola floriformis]|uniref:effector-associated domain EAD1-containing protein n=1 Tax=Anatilimnocola floriformis TaxID=2948575 RepID=UPI0020C2F793|nr:effector-associated domain EAD1-containing protein [Anatilimnocola floriformis]